jgi:hypothetical protein
VELLRRRERGDTIAIEVQRVDLMVSLRHE